MESAIDKETGLVVSAETAKLDNKPRKSGEYIYKCDGKSCTQDDLDCQKDVLFTIKTNKNGVVTPYFKHASPLRRTIPDTKTTEFNLDFNLSSDEMKISFSEQLEKNKAEQERMNQHFESLILKIKEKEDEEEKALQASAEEKLQEKRIDIIGDYTNKIYLKDKFDSIDENVLTILDEAVEEINRQHAEMIRAAIDLKEAEIEQDAENKKKALMEDPEGFSFKLQNALLNNSKFNKEDLSPENISDFLFNIEEIQQDKSFPFIDGKWQQALETGNFEPVMRQYKNLLDYRIHQNNKKTSESENSFDDLALSDLCEESKKN